MTVSTNSPATIGVLDLQGGIQEHLEHLTRLGVPVCPVKEPAQLDGVAGLIIPGGESTCLSRLIRIFGFEEPIRQAFARGMKLWGTCAGAILLAAENVGEAPFFGVIDIAVVRNAFGSQLDSFGALASVPEVADEEVPLTFIRAPKIIRVGPDVNVLLEMDGYVAAAETDDVLVTVFHPELTPSLAFHRYFVKKCGVDVPDVSPAPVAEAAWTRQSWMTARRHGE